MSDNLNVKDVRCTTIYLTNRAWKQRFRIPFKPDRGSTLHGSIGALFVPVGQVLGEPTACCVKTKESLVFFGYMLDSGEAFGPAVEIT